MSNVDHLSPETSPTLLQRTGPWYRGALDVGVKHDRLAFASVRWLKTLNRSRVAQVHKMGHEHRPADDRG